MSENIQKFCNAYRQAAERLTGVHKVEFIGSAASCKFVPGKSDIDVFVHGHRVPRESRRRAIALVRELNAKYQLGLERAPCQHPTPFFIDGHIKRILYRLLKGRYQFVWLRRIVKRIAPSYDLVWKLKRIS